MKKFFGEFKKFITRGNVLDMAVGVIVGGAFTGIVNGLSNFILKPIINRLLTLVLGSNGLEGVVTILSPAYKDVLNAEGVKIGQSLDLANSIYIDWGSFISAIINFLIIAFVLFTIVKVMNKIKESNEELTKAIKKQKLSKEDKKELKARGVKLHDIEAVKAYLNEKKQAEEAKKAEEAKLAEEKAAADRLANPTAEDLLKDIKALLTEKISK